MALLELADSIMTYRSRYLTRPVPPVLDLLVADDTNPRSVAFQLAALASHVDQLPRDPADEYVRTPRAGGCCRCSLERDPAPRGNSPDCDEDMRGRGAGATWRPLDRCWPVAACRILSELITTRLFQPFRGPPARRPAIMRRPRLR